METNIKENPIEFRRTLAPKVLEVSKSFPVVLITGPRQCGKTTLFNQCIKAEFEELKTERSYVTLDDVKLRNLAKTDPELFLQTYKFPILIDEVQYAPELFPYIKIIVDKENKTGLFWLTGSQQFSLMNNVSESLAGRVGILQLQGFSQSEIERNADDKKFTIPSTEQERKSILKNDFSIEELYKRIFRGSYPALYSRPQIETNVFYSSYIQTYLERDVKSILDISDVHSFYECMCVLAARTGQLLNYSEVARDVGVSVNTIKKWMSVLEASGIIYLLQPWSVNVTNRVIKTPKLYFLDTGLCCYLTQWQSSEALMNGIMSGAIFETYVISEIYKSWIHTGAMPNFYFYRDKEQHEIDLILKYDGELHPVEIKCSANPELSMTKSFSYLEKTGEKVGLGSVICLYKNFLPLSRTSVSLPVELI